MRAVAIVAVATVALLTAFPAGAAREAQLVEPRTDRGMDESRVVLWQDDLESGAPGWTHGDDSLMSPKFHIDTYLAYDDPEHETDYSWWCGELNTGFAGGSGYGNSWDMWLELPPVELGIVTVERTTWGAIKGMYRESSTPVREDPPARSVTPVLTFRYRYDCEAGYDYAWVEADSLGTWIPLNGGWDGRSGGWQNLGGGFGLLGYGDPVRIRFRFTSDAGFSDEDGLYMSDGGAFHVDDIRVHDAVTGEIFYWEDCDGGVGLSTPATLPPVGDYWRLIDNACQAYSGTRVWSTCWPDSTSVPPGLQNWLMTPVIDVGAGVYACTLHYRGQYFMSGNYGGSWQEWGTANGGATWTRTGWWYGHQCQFSSGPYGPCDHFVGSIPLFQLPWDGHRVAGKWVILTDQFGNGCDVEACPLGYCSSGITVDDVWIKAYYP